MHARVWLWPNLLSLDAPLVALLWQLFFLRCFDARGGAVPEALLVMTVWLIYAADRMLDAWRGAGGQARHEFARRHWPLVVPVWFGVLGLCGWLALTALPEAVLARGLALSAGVGLYLTAVHAAPEILRRDIPRKWSRAGSKEGAVAVMFALGTSLAAWPRIERAGDVLAIALFAALCWMNCAAIEDWESGKPARASVVIAAGLVGLLAALFLREHRAVIGCAETAAALGLMLLDRAAASDRLGFSKEAVRVLADAALLSPLLFLPAAGWYA